MAGWLDGELGGGAAWRELARLWRRARARPGRALLIAFGLTAALVASRAIKARRYDASVVFRVIEGDLRVGVAPQAKRELRQYVADVILTNAVLLEVVREHGLYPALLRRDPALAVAELREDLDVQVFRNYFLVDHDDEEDPPRTARITLRYTTDDPERALAVVRHLGGVVRERSAAARHEEAAGAALAASQAIGEAQADLLRRREEQARQAVALLRARPADAPGIRLDLAELERVIEADEARLKQAAEQRAGLDLRASAEGESLGLRFELADWGRAAAPRLPRWTELVALALGAFALLLPLCAVAVGAFDQRVYDLDDVRRLGLEPLGHVPAFPGDGVGTLASRTRTDAPGGRARKGPAV